MRCSIGPHLVAEHGNTGSDPHILVLSSSLKSIGKDPDAGRDWGQEEKVTTEDEMSGWHHQLDGHGFGWTPGVCDGQGGLVGYSPWGRKKSDVTGRLTFIGSQTWFFIRKDKGRWTRCI